MMMTTIIVERPMLNLTRRTALFGLLAAPAIIRTPGLLMPIKPQRVVSWSGWVPYVDFMNGDWIPKASVWEVSWSDSQSVFGLYPGENDDI